MCALEALRQLKKVGLDGSPIRIFRKNTSFYIDLDPRIGSLDLDKICKICPSSVFSIEDGFAPNEQLIN